MVTWTSKAVSSYVDVPSYREVSDMSLYKQTVIMSEFSDTRIDFRYFRSSLKQRLSLYSDMSLTAR